jgi:predicted  nucleic acid-binding Zn ribbon protein
MGCATLERAALRELSRHDSSLSRRGRAITEKITHATTIPTYTYLYRGSGLSRAQELRRRCPSCGDAWALAEPWRRFDFRCDRCRLVSNIAWNVR